MCSLIPENVFIPLFSLGETTSTSSLIGLNGQIFHNQFPLIAGY